MAQTINAELSTELDAVNQMLAAIGEAPVSDLTITESVDVADALDVLRIVDTLVQSHGWEWNRDYQFRINPDNDGFLQIPNRTLKIEKAYRVYSGSSTGTPIKIVQRGTRLYDPINHTFVFTDGMLLDIVTRQLWTDMPEPARMAIASIASRIFQAQKQGSATVDSMLGQVASRAEALLGHFEDETDPKNSITGSNDVQWALRGRGVRRTRRDG